MLRKNRSYRKAIRKALAEIKQEARNKRSDDRQLIKLDELGKKATKERTKIWKRNS